MSATLETPFRFFVETDAFEKAGAEPGKSRRIGGFISTEHKDRQQEILRQAGLDFDPFLQRGFLNDNHGHSCTDAVGYPILVERRSAPDGIPGTYMEGYLLEGYRKADDLWEQIQALKKAGWPRRIGFSVEGSIGRREGPDGKTISKAIVKHVAITHCPVNPHAELDALAKALCAGGDVGRPAGGPEAGNSFALRPESLESKPTVLAPTKPKKTKKTKKSGFTKSGTIARLLDRGYSVAAAERVWTYLTRR